MGIIETLERQKMHSNTNENPQEGQSGFIAYAALAGGRLKRKTKNNFFNRDTDLLSASAELSNHEKHSASRKQTI